MKKFWITHFPAILIGLTIFTLSSIPKLRPPDLGLEMQDKIFHIIAYFAFGTTLIHSGYFIFSRKTSVAGYTTGVGFVYALLDEFHQSFVPGRMCSVYDFIADCLGILLALGCLLFWLRRIIIRYESFFC